MVKKTEKKAKIKKILKVKARPIKTAICILCGNFNEPKKDKRGKPYIRCRHCLSFIFIHSEAGVIGYEILGNFVKKNRQALNDGINKELQKRYKEKADERDDEMLLGGKSLEST